MGVRYKSKVVYGFPATVSWVNTYETKYNEDTGEPYQKPTRTDDMELSVGGIVLARGHCDDLWELEEFEGLTIGWTGVDSDGGDLNRWLGVCVSEVNGEGPFENEINMVGKKIEVDAVNLFGHKHGLTAKFMHYMLVG